MTPRILVLGAGSIGRRHAANLASLDAVVAVTDPDPDRLTDLPPGIDGVDGGAAAFHGYDAVVVATPTSLHADQLLTCHTAGIPTLVEKPVAASREEVDELRRLVDDPPVMVGYNLRCFAPVRRAVSWLHEGRIGRPHHASVWFGSYLPDWRPSTDYRRTYSAQRALGGGVLNDAIHELDLVTWLFPGHVDVVGADLHNSGELDIDVEDTVAALLRSDDGVRVQVSLDYLSRRYRRGFEVVGSEGTLRVDWARKEVSVTDGAGVHEAAPLDWDIARSYEEEAAIFLDVLAGRARPPVDLDGGLRSVELAAAIREAAAWT